MSLINCKVELALEGFERSYNEYNEYKTKNETKHTTNEHRYLLKSNFLGFKRLFALIYLSRNNDIKQFNARKYNFPKGIIKNYLWKNFYDQAIDSDKNDIKKLENYQQDKVKITLLDVY